MTTLSEYRLNPYPQYLWVVFSDNFDQASQKITRKLRKDSPTTPHFNTLAPEDYEQCLGFVTSHENVHIAYFHVNPEAKKRDSIFDECARGYQFSHEAVHVMSRAFLACGIHYDRENDEPAAYLLSYIVSCMYTEWMDVKDKFPNP
jgi:hypothetical protein